MLLSRPRHELSGRLRAALGIGVLAAICAGFIVAISTADYRLTVLLAALVASPALVLLALWRPFLFPYGLYVLLIPFDGLLEIAGTGTITKLLGIAATAFVVIDIMRRRAVGRPPLALYLLLAYLAWTVVSVMWTIDLPRGLTDVQTMTSLIVMYAVLSVAPIGQRDLRLICACVVLGGIAASLYGMVLLHNMPHDTGDYGRLMIDVDDRHVDPNHFANSLLAPLALALVALVRARTPGMVLAMLAAVAIVAGGILISLSREALLAAVVIGVVLVWFSRRRVLGLAILVPVLAALPLLVPSIGRRMGDAFATGGAGRLSIWHIGWRSFTQHPLFGWGAGGSVEAYDRNFLAVYQAYSNGWTRPPHNTPLHVMIELGVVGLVLFLLAFVTVFRQFRGIRRGDELYDLRVGLTAALVGVAFVSLFIDLINYKYLWIVLTSVAQLAVVAGARRSVPAPAAPAAAPAPPAPPLGRPVPAAR